MSHELRTPLNAILGFGQLLAADVKAPDDRESVEQILHAGGHLLPAKHAGGREPPLAGDQLVTVAPGADHDRLHEAVLAEARRQLDEVGIVDNAPRLPGIRIDAFWRNFAGGQGGCHLLDLVGRVQHEPRGARA